MNNQAMVPPPPPGPPPGAPQNSLSSGWAQQNQWSRPQGYIPPPPPLNPHQYSGHPTYQQNLTPAPLNIPPPPPQQQQQQQFNSGEPNLVSATYIPGGESFGPGVGIPPLYSYQQQEPSRDDSFSYTTHEAKLLQDQRFYNGPSSAISGRGELPALPGTTPVSQTPLSRQPNSFRSSNDSVQTAQTPMSTTRDTPPSAHHHSNSNSSLLSPNDPKLVWPLDKVLSWLAVNGFSNDWQETFKGLDIHGSDFLDLGRGNNGRGNFGMMHQLVYPRLARECGKSGSGWNQDRERNEGRRMRRLVRKVAEGTEGAPTGGSGGHGRRESLTMAPSASTDGGVESSPNQTPHPDGISSTPSTAGGEDSPRGQFRSAAGTNPRTNSKARSSTVPIPMYSNGGAASSETVLPDISKSGSNRSGQAKGILNNINDAASKRHSPSASEVGTGTPTSTFIGDAIRGSYDASPQSGSPATQHAQLGATPGSGTLSAPPYGRGHRKTNSSDSMTSNQTSNSVSNLLRGQDRRNGHETHRPPTLDVIGKVSGSNDTPTSAKELSKGFLDRFRRRKKDDSSHPSPEDQSLESPTSPQNYRHMPPALPFARGKNGSSTSLDRPGSASAQTSEHEKMRKRDHSLTKASGGRRYAFVTPDQWNYRLVDISEAENADAVRENICKALNYTDYEMALIYLTEPGQTDHDEPLTDAFLMASRHTKGDSYGSLKFYVRRGPTSASLPPPLSAGLGIGLSPKASPPAGSLFPRKALDEDGLARIRSNGRTRSKSPPIGSRQNTLKADSATPKDATPRKLDIPDGDDGRLTESPPETAKQRLQSMSLARKSGTISESEWGSYLAAAIEEHRLEMERQGKDYRLGRLAAGQPSSNRTSTGSGREINFDDPNRGSPYDRLSKPDPLVPLRKPPAPPPGSIMLEKANSLTRRQGESLRSSVASQSDLMKRLSKGESISEESEDKWKRKAIVPAPSDSTGIPTGALGTTAGPPIGSRRNLPLRDINERNQGKQTTPLSQVLLLGGNNFECPQRFIDIATGKFTTLYSMLIIGKVLQGQ